MVAGVVLAGGAGRRMGGLDKSALRVGGVTLLDRVLAAAQPVCDRLLVVGPLRPTKVPDVEFVSENTPGGGPVPAVLAGVRAVQASGPGCDVILVMAADLPLLSADHLRRLVAALDPPGVDAAASAEVDGPNALLAAYRIPPLVARAVGPDFSPGAPARRLLPDSPVLVDLGPASLNVNRPEELAAAEVLAVHDEQVVTTTQWLRGLVMRTIPDARESVLPESHAFGYHRPEAGYVCAVFPREDGARLSFEHGALLADPRRLLRGGGGQARHVDVRVPDDPPAELLVRLMDAAIELGSGPGQTTRWTPV